MLLYVISELLRFRYLNHEAEIAKESATKELLLGIAKHDEDFAKTIVDAVKSSDLATQVQNQSYDGFEALVRRRREPDGIRIQGRSLSKSDVIELNRQTRRLAKPVTLTKKVRVLSVDSSNPEGFVVRMEDIDDGEVLSASMFDAIVIERYGK